MSVGCVLDYPVREQAYRLPGVDCDFQKFLNCHVVVGARIIHVSASIPESGCAHRKRNARSDGKDNGGESYANAIVEHVDPLDSGC
jgi:hypothetical protein